MGIENTIVTHQPDATANKAANRWILIIALIVVAGAVAIFVWRAAVSPRGQAIEDIVNGLSATDVQPLGKVILTNFKEFRDNSTRWSAAYFSCLLFSAVFSAFAGFVLKLKAFRGASVAKEDLAALLAMLAALLITLSSAGDFQRKWQANRIAAADTEELAYGLLKTPFNESDKELLIKKLKEIASTRNREIVGDKASGSPASENTSRGNPITTPTSSPPANSNSNKP